jgi:hypothetical protein
MEHLTQQDTVLTNKVKETLESHPAIAQVVPENELLNPFVSRAMNG